ncbi:hypothetical protein EJV47_03855 [Hymenobacter gummosus]|uniref:DUF4369 domain-containing protein n=1 Tax=Hymenobacter gummosus TaxID=1776032 RepID=A0A3S0JCD5_9BACT|nr:hypothetical protein [Hymenobacter gummosus]RTQ52170.1 hypothetical protein EJV47_03855 [Hymenobacter gummosus]
MRKQILPLLLLLLPAPAVLAQGVPINEVQSLHGGQPGNGLAYNTNQYLMMAKPMGAMIGVKGSPYADARWLPARLVMTNNAPFDPMSLKYDVLNGRILMRVDSRPQDSLQLNDNLLAQFELEEPATLTTPARKRVFRRFVEAYDPQQRHEYVEVLHQGQYTLVKRYVKTLRAGSRTGVGDPDNQILSHQEYYLIRPNASAVPVKLNVKSISTAAPDLAERLKADAAAQKARKDADWTTVLAAVDPRK